LLNEKNSNGLLMSYSLIHKQFHANKWLYLFLFIHLTVWTLTPALVRFNLPLDSVEGALWGHQLEWGYDKNPYLNGWLTALAIYLDNYSGYLVYFFSQLCVVASLWATWQLAKKIVPPLYALAAVLLLESVQYFNLHAIDFNDNTLELGLWALTIYFFYQALRDEKRKDWMLTGLFAGLSLMAKYYSLALFAGMILCVFFPAENRRKICCSAPLWGISIFTILVLPHVIWLFFHDFITIRYVFQRAHNTPSWTNHFFYPSQFAWQQLQVLAPMLIPLGILSINRKTTTAHSEPLKINNFDFYFLFFVGVMPFLLTVMLSFILGITLRAGWGMPLFTTSGILLLAILKPHLTIKKLVHLFLFNLILLTVLVSGYSFSLIHSSTSSANFPGRDIAKQLTQLWHDTYHSPLHYVAGSRWVGGNITLYSKDHPAVLVEWNTQRATWINIQDLQKKGAIFVWYMAEEGEMPERVRQQFPALQKTKIMEFNWHRNKNENPLKLGVAILPPALL
jgi:4-amino-4-deoxy-L-arabinose transferase-like glycosyltransferase